MSGTSPYVKLAQPDHTLPEWLRTSRHHGLEVWSSSSMPGEKDEDWKYVDLDFALDDFRPAGEPSAGLGHDDYIDVLGSAGGSLTLVDGTVVGAEGDEPIVGGLLDVDEDAIAPHYRTVATPEIDVFSAANQAFAPPGGVVLFPAGRAVRSPVLVDVQSVTHGSVGFPHITVVGGPGSEGSVLLVYRSAPGARVLVSPVVEVIAGQNAHLSVSVVQHLGDSARMVAHHHFVADRDATLRINEVGLGGRYARQRLGINLAGHGSSVKMGGIYFGDGSQVLDYRTFVTHYGPRTTSDIFLKGAVADSSQAVWTGLMRIENPAAGTSAFETNRNLVLSDRAKVHSVPNLEILTDDLQCGHGSSSGPLDEEQLYYLMSRGVVRDRAERLLVRGFFDEILSDLAIPRLAVPARVAVANKFAAVQGRVGS